MKHNFALVLISFFFIIGWASASDTCTTGCPCACETPELWLINSRCAPKCDGLDEGFEKLTYQRYDREACKFVTESRESFLAAQANIPTLLFSHGNTLDHEAAMKVCWKVYERMKVCPGPKMLVFWSWPSEIYYTRPLLRPVILAKTNIKAKYVFAERQGYYIAKLTNMMSTAQPLTLSGHSYGGVTIICALHLIGGGSLDCLTLAEGKEVERKNLRGAVISGALDYDALYPGYRYDKALVVADGFYTTYNNTDSTLKRWPNHSFRCQEALGYVGLCTSRLGENAHKVRQDRLTEDVGKSHYITPHLASCQMVNAICQMAFESKACCNTGSGNKNLMQLGSDGLEQFIERPAAAVFPGLGL